MKISLISDIVSGYLRLTYVWVALTGVTLLFTGCNASKLTLTPEEERNLVHFMGANHLILDAKYAFPQLSSAYVRGANSIMSRAGGTISRINLTGQRYFLEIANDSVFSYLPYFGEWDNFYDSGAAGSINLSSEVRGLEKRLTKNSVQIKFAGRRKAERLNFKVNIHPDGKYLMQVLSGQRDPIRYEGILRVTLHE